MTLAIDIEGLSKTFGTTAALDGLDLSVTEGEVHGFLGPNGAGKSTTIRILLGLLKADAGSAKLSAEIPGGRDQSCTAGSRTYPATCRCGRTCPGER